MGVSFAGLVSILVKQARPLQPLMFIAHDPHIPSRQDLLNVSDGSISFLILIRASSTIGPQSFVSMVYVCMWGLSTFSGFHLYMENFLGFTGLPFTGTEEEGSASAAVDVALMKIGLRFLVLRAKAGSLEQTDIFLEFPREIVCVYAHECKVATG